MATATALAHPNIAFIKYWGNRDDSLRLPQNGSISMNLEALFTRTTVSWVKPTDIQADTLVINGSVQSGEALQRVGAHLDLVRGMARMDLRAEVVTENNFPAGAGIASSSSAFAALTVAATTAAGLDLDAVRLSRLARRGSGSACRSIPAGFVEWKCGTSDDDSYAQSIFPPEHWDLMDLVAIISSNHKTTGSTRGHSLAATSPLQEARVKDAPRRLSLCRQALLKRDFDALAAIIEADSNLMHAVMMTSMPPLFYWQEATLSLMHAIREARAAGLAACTTVDAGPNVHIICERDAHQEALNLAKSIPRVQEVMISPAGGPARLLQVED